MNTQQIAEAALAGLLASRRDAAWLADALLDAARPEVFNHQSYRELLALAAKAASVRDALCERIALLEPKVAAIVADQKHDGETDARHH